MYSTLDRLIGRPDPHTIQTVPSPVKPGSSLTFCSCLSFHVITHTGEENRLRAAVDAHRAAAGIIGRAPRVPREQRIPRPDRHLLGRHA